VYQLLATSGSRVFIRNLNLLCFSCRHEFILLQNWRSWDRHKAYPVPNHRSVSCWLRSVWNIWEVSICNIIVAIVVACSLACGRGRCGNSIKFGRKQASVHWVCKEVTEIQHSLPSECLNFYYNNKITPSKHALRKVIAVSHYKHWYNFIWFYFPFLHGTNNALWHRVQKCVAFYKVQSDFWKVCQYKTSSLIHCIQQSHSWEASMEPECSLLCLKVSIICLMNPDRIRIN